MTKTKRFLCLLALLTAVCSASSQRLFLQKRYGSEWGRNMLTLKNKPNGTIYRMRKDVQCTDLPRVSSTEDKELYIAEPIDIGWLGFYRLPTRSEDYDFVVVLYDHEKQPIHVVNLGYITGNHYCEVQDVRWDGDNHRLLFNMACPSYAAAIDGKGSKLYSYSPDEERIVWETDYLVSNDIFIADRNFVFCSYGFSSEKKFLYMLDKQTGQVYSKLPMTYKVEYLELAQEGGREVLYALDYNDHLFSFAVSGKPAAKTRAAAAGKEPEVFTVVYATSSDGFMNVRQQPNSKSAILGKVYQLFHGMGNGVLREKGATWSKVSVGNATGWVYNKYLGYLTWYKGDGRPVLVAARDATPIYAEDYSDQGSYPLFTTVKKGTIIADDFEEHNGYYELRTAHDYLFIKTTDAVVRR